MVLPHRHLIIAVAVSSGIKRHAIASRSYLNMNGYGD
jgi:hypothetical protein